MLWPSFPSRITIAYKPTKRLFYHLAYKEKDFKKTVTVLIGLYITASRGEIMLCMLKNRVNYFTEFIELTLQTGLHDVTCQNRNQILWRDTCIIRTGIFPNEIINIPDSSAAVTVTAFSFSCLKSLKLYGGFFCGKKAVLSQVLLQWKIRYCCIMTDVIYCLK